MAMWNFGILIRKKVFFSFYYDLHWVLASRSADYKIYCDNLRNIKAPWWIFSHHMKTMDNIKSLDSTNLASASIDGTLKPWNSKTSTKCVHCNPILTCFVHKMKRASWGFLLLRGIIPLVQSQIKSLSIMNIF